MDCGIFVHPKCYGLSSIDITNDRLFVCDACKAERRMTNQSDRLSIKCILCPVLGGALKRTSCNNWCHLFCALWIPEVGIANKITKSPIINIDKIPSFRKRKVCAICKNKKSNHAYIKCEYADCNEYVHPICCALKHRNSKNLKICKNDILNVSNNNPMVQKAVNAIGPFLWYFVCAKHEKISASELKRIQILKLLQSHWPYWKIHPNPIFFSQSQAMANINSSDLLRESLPTQRIIKRYENMIHCMHNMPLSLASNIGPIGLLDACIKKKYQKNAKYGTNLNKTSQSMQWNQIQNTLNYDINAADSDFADSEKAKSKQTKDEKANDLSQISLYDKLKSDDIELSRNEVINLLWNSKEKFFSDISCTDYLRISPYDYRCDSCFGQPLIGKSFFDFNHETIKQMTSIHHYSKEVMDTEDESMMFLNQSMGLPVNVNFKQLPIILHKLGLNEGENVGANEVSFENESNINDNGWNGKIGTYQTERDPMGWRWVLNRWKPPKHLESVSCVCLQCRESVHLYNQKYVKAMNDYEKIQKLLPKSREMEQENQQIDEKKEENERKKEVTDPKILQFQKDSNNEWKKIPVIIQNKYGKVLAEFKAKNVEQNEKCKSMPMNDCNPANPPPIYEKLNDILEAQNTPKPKVQNAVTNKYNLSMSLFANNADDISDAAMNALYKQQKSSSKKRNFSQMMQGNDTNYFERPSKRCKVELDSFRQLQNVDIVMSDVDKKDSLCKHLSDSVYELYERMRSNDSIKHMIRTNLANKVKTKSMIEYEKLHQIVTKHFVEHCCVWLKIRTSLQRGYSDQSGTFFIQKTEDDDEDYSVCTVCFDGGFSGDNPIVFCDSCNVGIHRFCYGIKHIPERNEVWNCDACEWLIQNGKIADNRDKASNNGNGNGSHRRKKKKDARMNKMQCCLCPIKGCALKQTKCGGFAHVACALWIDGIEIADLKTMNPICNVLDTQTMQCQSAMKIHTKMLQNGLSINNGLSIKEDENEQIFVNEIGEWTQHCVVCGDDNGCFVECSHPQCIKRMHPLCAWFAGFHQRIDIDSDKGSIIPIVYCLEHTPLKYGGIGRDLNYFKQLRGNGSSEKQKYAELEEKRQNYQNFIDEDVVVPDTYRNGQCSICFTSFRDIDVSDADQDSFRLLKCANCGIEVHAACYCIDGNVDIGWRCDVCFVYPKYYKTLIFEEDDQEQPSIECSLCPRRGGSFKVIGLADDKICNEWVHVACGQWCKNMIFSKAKNKFLMHSAVGMEKNERICYLCNQQKESNDFTLHCQFDGCDKSFHAICGLFGDCYLMAHKNENENDKNAMFEYKFFCKQHKYANYEKPKSLKINYDNLGIHLLNIKKLQCKLDKIKITKERINEYELAQRGILNHSTMSYKECGKKMKKKKHRKKKNKKYEYNDHDIPDDDDNDTQMTDFSMDSLTKKQRKKVSSSSGSKSRSKIKSKVRMKKEKKKEYEMQNIGPFDEEQHQFTMRKTRSSNKKKVSLSSSSNTNANRQNSKNVHKKSKNVEQIRMATDIWAEQYQYAGGEIKWPVIKRNGWFMAIPRLKLPKGNKYRYSHKERRAKQELIKKEKEKKIRKKEPDPEPDFDLERDGMALLLNAIKEKEAELAMKSTEDIEMKEKEQSPNSKKWKSNYEKYKTGGENWEFVEESKPVLVDPETCKVCPLCRKEKNPNVSKPNWQKHLHAKHQFKCKKCSMMFTRHPILQKHLEQCAKL